MKLKRSQAHRGRESGNIRAWLLGVLALVVLGYLWLRHHEPPIQPSKPPQVRHQVTKNSSRTDTQLPLSPPAGSAPQGPLTPPRSDTTPRNAPTSLEGSRIESKPEPLTLQTTDPAPGTPSPPPPATAPSLTNNVSPSSPAPLPPAATLRTNPPALAITNAPSTNSTRPRRLSRGEDPELAKGYSQAALEYQLALAKRGFYSGSLDGKLGSQSRAAIRAFQEQNNLNPTGLLTQETRDLLFLESPLLATYSITPADVARLRPLSNTWLGKSQQDRLDFETLLELVSESFMAHPALIQRLNPSVDWNLAGAGTTVQVPNVDKTPWKKKAGSIHIQLSKRCLQVYDVDNRLMQHMPCSIGHIAEKRPMGNLKVQVIAPNPNYTFNPAVFPESEEARQLGRKLRIEPGPNNPVGVAWIGLDRPGYGIHGTPNPEQVGRTESHGCFRLANWNAEQLARIVWVGLPVTVDP